MLIQVLDRDHTNPGRANRQPPVTSTNMPAGSTGTISRQANIAAPSADFFIVL
jgi:hypothetical protein